jgi:hypothetical protein
MLAAALGVAAKAYICKPCGAVLLKKVSKLRRRYLHKQKPFSLWEKVPKADEGATVAYKKPLPHRAAAQYLRRRY